MRQELAAQSSLALEARIDEARQQLATHPAVGQSADPLVVGLTAVLGTEEATLRRGLALLLAVLVEVGPTFGFALAHAATAKPQSPRSHAPHRTDSPPRIGNAPKAGARNPAPSAVVSFAEQAARLKRRRRRTVQSLARWADECMQRDNDGCVGARNGYAAYCQWADHVGVEAVTETRFGRFLTAKVTAMGGSKTKCRVGTVYIGICIAEAPAPQAARMAA